MPVRTEPLHHARILKASRALRALAALLGIAGCAHAVASTSKPDAIPVALVGDFVDDYGIRYSISAAEWFQKPQARYRIDHADTTAGYLIARNDDNNPGEKGRWSRIDWITLDGMRPFEWAFCLSAYDAPTREAAEAVALARRDTPKTGCGGYPFSRMRRATATDMLKDTPYTAPRSR